LYSCPDKAGRSGKTEMVLLLLSPLTDIAGARSYSWSLLSTGLLSLARLSSF
jgi:hypothetical protein